MLTMTRIPSDSFLPSGAMLDPNPHQNPFGAHVNGHSSSVISPLSLPNPISSLSFFDDPQQSSVPPPNYAHPPSVARAPRSQQYLSPDLSLSTFSDQRSSSLPPTSHLPRSAVESPNILPTSNPSFFSPLEAMSSSQSAASLLQRREEHSRRLLESWQAERAHLEANRARAEEMFREERDLMDHERMMWVAEKIKLENDVLEWKKKAEMAESERDRLAELLKGTNVGSGQSFDGTAEASTGGMRGGNSGSPGTGPPTSIKIRSPSEKLSPGIGLGPTMPESKPFVPLDPRMQGPSPGTVSPSTERVPSIDVHEVIPGLEGIRLKKPAVQKPTFVDGKISSPPTELQKTPPPSSSNPPSTQSKATPAELTKETLRAPEARRLVMHAGHTPNHSVSLSRIQTTESTNAPNTADSSGTATPTPQMTGSQSEIGSLVGQQQSAEVVPAPQSSEVLQAQHDSKIGDQPLLEPSEGEPVLKGPLHLKNRPAADELFLQKVYDKLEHVKANNVPPSVLDVIEAGMAQDSTESESSVKADADEAHAAPEDSTEDVDEDIPIKFKKSTNFGQPLGKLGSSTGL
ncbi:hypothetical protein F5X99DRAFT_418379 [Biscogniauxia marginata]|nr:hypothetical protein F5X99DRAFT_418379 [Biscogniauxia marginata]